jgi:hypothetical protein
MKSKRKDIYALFVFFIAYVVSGSFESFSGWVLGMAFLISFLYGVIQVFNDEKFIFR